MSLATYQVYTWPKILLLIVLGLGWPAPATQPCTQCMPREGGGGGGGGGGLGRPTMCLTRARHKWVPLQQLQLHEGGEERRHAEAHVCVPIRPRLLRLPGLQLPLHCPQCCIICVCVCKHCRSCFQDLLLVGCQVADLPIACICCVCPQFGFSGALQYRLSSSAAAPEPLIELSIHASSLHCQQVKRRWGIHKA